jgi:two-component sensor histidine kinase/GAF domain-containing protein
MNESKPTYEELKSRLAQAEELIAVLSHGEVDAVFSRQKVLLLRLKETEDALRASNYQLQASEKQLREANQQLVAREEELLAANQQLDASNQQLRGSQEELSKVNHDLQERAKELECLYGLSQLVEQRDITLEEIFQGLVELIPPGWQYPEITAARIIFGDGRFQTNNFSETEWVQSADIKVNEQKAGTVEVCYPKERPEIDEGPFPKKERNLLNVLAERLGHIIERMRAEEALRAANQQLQANGQQLKAANEQLRASEQQLKAANQQLRANEQQLRAANQQLQAEIAERKRAEEKIQASLREKEVLLKEIHHRVKNNMQVISSILNLQSKHIEDEQTLKMFRNGQGRIRSMALVHEKLYESEDLAKIDFGEYIRSTTSYLFSLHRISEAVRLNIDIEDIFLDINTAIPCGLIINELVSNALKYAFPDGREGEIRVGLYSDKDGKFALIIKDNGIGFPKDMDFRNTGSLGMQLVIMLTEQIEGTVELDRSEGTAFTITFEKPKH